MELLDLIPEILKIIFEHFVNDVGLFRAPKYRLVCSMLHPSQSKHVILIDFIELFDREIIDAIFVTRIIDETPNGVYYLMESSFNTRYVQTRISSKGRNSNHFRCTVNLTVDLLLRSAPIQKFRHSRGDLITTLQALALERPHDLLNLLDDSSRTDRYKCGEETAAEDAELNRLVDYDYKHLLTAATYIGDASLVKTLLQDGVDIQKGSEYFGKPISIAASRGFNDILILLLDHDADTENKKAQANLSECLTENAESLSIALREASFAGHEHTVRLLLEPKYNIDRSGRWYEVAALSAASGGHSALVQLLIKAGGGQLKNSTSLKQEMVLDASWCGQDEVIRMLLDDRISPNCTDYQTRTPLEIAAMKGHTKVVQLLLKKGANPNAGYNYPLILASKHGHKRIAEILLDYGANIDQQLYPAPVAAAAMNGQAHMVSFLVERGADLNLLYSGALAIDFAASHGWESVVSMLVDYGVSIDGSEHAPGPMQSAVRAGHDHAVKRLTELRAKTTHQVECQRLGN